MMQGPGKECREQSGVQIPQNNGLFPALVPRVVLSAWGCWCETYSNQCLFLPPGASQSKVERAGVKHV